MACSMVYSKSLLRNVVKTFPIANFCHESRPCGDLCKCSSISVRVDDRSDIRGPQGAPVRDSELEQGPRGADARLNGAAYTLIQINSLADVYQLMAGS